VPTLRRPFAPLPLALAALVIGAVVLVLAVVVGGLGRSAAPAGTPAQGFTLEPTAWTLDSVLAEARGGNLTAIGTISPPADPVTGAQAAPLLVARTAKGVLEPIRLEVPVRDALTAIRAAGFGPLLTDEAIALGGTGSGSNTAQMLFGLALSVAILFLLVSLLHRNGHLRRPGRLGRGRGRRRSERRAQGDGVERPTVSLADVAGFD